MPTNLATGSSQLQQVLLRRTEGQVSKVRRATVTILLGDLDGAELGGNAVSTREGGDAERIVLRDDKARIRSRRLADVTVGVVHLELHEHGHRETPVGLEMGVEGLDRGNLTKGLHEGVGLLLVSRETRMLEDNKGCCGGVADKSV